MEFQLSQYHPVRFVDVRLEGDFWKERLDTVLKTTMAILETERSLAAVDEAAGLTTER